MTKLELLTECCICRDWKDKQGNYYTPRPEERKDVYHKHKPISHGMCDPCYILWEEGELGLEVKK